MSDDPRWWSAPGRRVSAFEASEQHARVVLSGVMLAFVLYISPAAAVAATVGYLAAAMLADYWLAGWRE